MTQAGMCSGKTGAEYLLDFQFIKAVTCPYFDAAGPLVTGLLVWAAVSMGIFIRTGSTVIPFVLLLLTGGAIMGTIAGPGMAIATVLVLTTGAGIMTLLYRSFSQ